MSFSSSSYNLAKNHDLYKDTMMFPDTKYVPPQYEQK